MLGAAMTALDDAYARALESWRELEESSVPVFRVGAATCGRAARADKVLARLRVVAPGELLHLDMTIIKLLD